MDISSAVIERKRIYQFLYQAYSYKIGAIKYTY